MEAPPIEWRRLPAALKLSRYQVSSAGNVRSETRTLKSKPRITGYVYSTLTNDDGKIVVYMNHQLVAYAFLPPDPTKTFIDHINGDRADNRVSNLRRVTPQENSVNQHAKPHGRKGKPVAQLDLQGNVLKLWPSVKGAAEALGLHAVGISACANGKLQTSGGYTWTFASEDPDEPEEWKEVEIDGTLVSVSSLGRVKLKTTTTYGNASPNGKTVLIEPNHVTYSVHRLVCRAFHGEPAHDDLQVRHVDHDKLNNRADNLEWTTHWRLCLDRNDRSRTSWGRRVHQIGLDGEIVATHRNMADAARAVPRTSRASICACCLGKTRSSGSFGWAYAEEEEEAAVPVTVRASTNGREARQEPTEPSIKLSVPIRIPRPRKPHHPDSYAGRAVEQWTTDGTFVARFRTIADAAKIGVASAGSISNCCRGASKSAGGFAWKYAKEMKGDDGDAKDDEAEE